MTQLILKKYLGFCSYVGLKYQGYQEQPQGVVASKTIQSTIQVFYSKNEVKITSCSRTDAGVSAYSLPFHFTLPLQPQKPIASPDILKKSLNYHLRYEDIKILEIKNVDLDFNVRKQCIEKEYIYKIEAGIGENIWSPIQQYKLVYSVKPRLDLTQMRKGLQEFLGVHNFYNFTSRDNSKPSESFRFKRRINEVFLIEENPELNEDKHIQKVTLGFKAKGFLTYQIRYMVNALKDVGEGNYSIEDIRDALEIGEELREAEIGKKPAPAKGLFLKNVTFGDFEKLEENV